jgi:hypothetical protein
VTTWDDLVTAALLGTSRRVPDLAALPGTAGRAAATLPESEPAAALLDAAALAGTQRRAGWVARHDIAVPRVAADDLAPNVPPTAAARLHDLLVTGETDLLLLWLHAAAAGDWRAPESALPALLDAAVADGKVAAAAMPVLGERGRWLAGFHPRWTRVVAATGADAADAADATDPELWRVGGPAQRRAYFAVLRERDPAAARALLAESWPQETPKDRATFVGLLATGLSLADETLLEMALDDRSGDVRKVATRLLVRLPGSAMARRMAARANACVRSDRKMLRSRLVVTAPAERDAGMARDGVVDPPRKRTGSGASPGMGVGAFLLVQLFAAAPLRTWTDRFGSAPERILSLAVADGWSDVLRLGWTRGAIAQADLGWARALLAQDPGPDPALVADLLRVLPPGERGDAVAGLLDRAAPDALVGPLLDSCPGPWSRRLAAAVLNWFARRKDRPYAVRQVLRLAGLRLPADAASAVMAIGGLQPEDSAWRHALLDVADTLTYRSEMLKELE